MLPLVLAAATGVVGLIGWLWWRGDGTMHRGSGERVRPEDVLLPDDAFGPVATLLLLGTQQDERTDLVRERLATLAEGTTGVVLAEVDLTAHGALAGRYAVTRSPTVFVLDARGGLRSRVRGAADPDTLRAALETALRPVG